MPLWNHGGMNASFYLPLFHFGNGQEFNTISKFSTKLYIQRCDFRNSPDEDFMKSQGSSKSKADQNGKLMSRIDPLDVIGWVRLRVSFLLGLLQDFFEVSSFVRHLGKDVV